MMAAAGGMLGLLGATAAPRQAAEPAWQTDYAAARETARKAGKPLFVVFR